MRKRIADVGATRLVGSKIIQEMPKVAHGTTAALSLGVKYPSIPSDVLKAVMHHTTASTRMSRLDMVVYVADALDPGRNYPEYNELAAMIGKECLEDLFCKVYGKSTIAVINKGQTLHPKTAVIWNKNVEMYNARHKK